MIGDKEVVAGLGKEKGFGIAEVYIELCQVFRFHLCQVPDPIYFL